MPPITSFWWTNNGGRIWVGSDDEQIRLDIALLPEFQSRVRHGSPGETKEPCGKRGKDCVTWCSC